jgi:predicted nucleotidyltransferase
VNVARALLKKLRSYFNGSRTSYKSSKTICRCRKTEFSGKKIILYGSYAKGSASEHSDIDVAVVLNNNKEDVLTSEAKLFKLRRDIDARIEPVLLDEQNDTSGFLEEITRTGEIIYSSD